jgi:glycerol-3-phosphate dehydrogenase (NAD(P)+)
MVQLGRIGIIGNGSFGTALAKILTDNGHQLQWWMRSEAAVQFLQEKHHNPTYLSSVHFPAQQILPTTDLNQVLYNCDTVVFAVPSAYAVGVLQSTETCLWNKVHFISAIKGILPGTGKLLNAYLADTCETDPQQYVAITGPCHAEEVAQERLSCLTFSGMNADLTETVAQTFATPYLHTRFNKDVWGAQFAAVLKNIYAVGAGMAHGLDYGDNFMAVYITACFREMHKFVKKHFRKLHADEKLPDFLTSAYLGDLLVTCYSLHSRNRAFGMMVGKGYSVKAAQMELNMVAEGYYASQGMMQVAEESGIKLPIATLMYKVLWEGLPARKAFRKLEDKIG